MNRIFTKTPTQYVNTNQSYVNINCQYELQPVVARVQLLFNCVSVRH